MEAIYRHYENLFNREIENAARFAEKYERCEISHGGNYSPEIQRLQDNRKKWMWYHRAKAVEYRKKMMLCN